MTKRRDNKGRVLQNGEVQLSNGSYRYKYVDSWGKEQYLYSWRLGKQDPYLAGKVKGPSLREQIEELQRDKLNGLVTCDMTVLELVERYLSTKVGVRRNTKANYGTVVNVLKKDSFGARKISSVRISDAKIWLIKLQQEQGKSYSSIHSIRGVLRPAFQMAFDDDMIRKNPFQFQLVDVIVNDSVRREAITRDEERKFLDFVKNDKHFSRFYEGVYVLFKTGMRISEFCGLTVSDIDFQNHTLRIDHQLQKRGSTGYYIEETKTTAGRRVIPMTPDVEACFRRIILKRNPPRNEPKVQGRSGFLFFDKNGSIIYSLHWEHYFKHMVQKYNSIYKVPLPKISPHVCRHTYCSNMAKSGMNPKTLQYLMGHSEIGVTMNTYTHVNLDDAVEEVKKVYKAQ